MEFPGLQSAMGQKQTRRNQMVMSALPPKADIRPRDQDVCFGPEADISHARHKGQLLLRRRFRFYLFQPICIHDHPCLFLIDVRVDFLTERAHQRLVFVRTTW